MDYMLCCRLCAGIADPGASLVTPGKQTIAKWIENNLGYEFNTTNGFPTKVCYPCLTSVHNWILFVQNYKTAHIQFKNRQMGNEILPLPSDEVQEPQEQQVSVVKNSPTKKITKKEKSTNSTIPKTLLDKWLEPSQSKDDKSNINVEIKKEIKKENDTKQTKSIKIETQIKEEHDVKHEIKTENDFKKEAATAVSNPKDNIQQVRQALNVALISKIKQSIPQNQANNETGEKTKRITEKRNTISKVKKEQVKLTYNNEGVEEITLDSD